MIQAWKVIRSKVLIKDPWISIRQETCETTTGHIIDPFYVLDIPNWVVAVTRTRDNKFVLVKQYRHGIGNFTLEFPAGLVDAGDKDFIETAQLLNTRVQTNGHGSGHGRMKQGRVHESRNEREREPENVGGRNDGGVREN